MDERSAETRGRTLDHAAKMIQVARKKRGNDACRFDVVAAENLPYEDGSFDAVVSSLFFHHMDLDLKQRTLAESFRILPPGVIETALGPSAQKLKNHPNHIGMGCQLLDDIVDLAAGDRTVSLVDGRISTASLGVQR